MEYTSVEKLTEAGVAPFREKGVCPHTWLACGRSNLSGCGSSKQCNCLAPGAIMFSGKPGKEHSKILSAHPYTLTFIGLTLNTLLNREHFNPKR